MRRIDPGLKLVLVGDGPLRKELAQRCPDAVFCGFRTGQALAVHYASADIFLFPSITETFGNVTPEAMASGLAVLAYDYAAAAQLIQSGHNGLLAPFNDLPEFIRQAQQLAAQPAQARTLAEQARQTALALDWDLILGQVETVFHRALQAHEQANPAVLRDDLAAAAAR